MRLRPIALAIALLGLGRTASAQLDFTYRTLTAPAGRMDPKPTSMNAHGDVVGVTDDAAFLTEATLWIDGVPQTLGTLAGTTQSYATAMNQRREVVGYAVNGSSSTFRPFLWDPTNGMRELPRPANFTKAVPHDVNDDGTIVGIGWLSNGATHVLRWDRAGNVAALGVPAGYFAAFFLHVNAHGEISGSADTVSATATTGFRYDDVNGFRLLPPPASGSTEAYSISDDGVVFGTALDTEEMVLWTGLVPTSLGKGMNNLFAHAHERTEQGRLLAHGYRNYQFFDGTRWDYVNDLLPVGGAAVELIDADLAENGCLFGRPLDANNHYLPGCLLEPATRLEIEGGQVGGSVAFRHVAPTHPGKVAATLVSLTGMAGNFHVGRGVHVRLDFDIATSTLLGFPGIGVLTLDGNGRATTAAIDIDNDPALSGLPAWACSVVFQGGKTPPVPSTTVPFILE